MPGNVSHWWSCSPWAQDTAAGLYCCVKHRPEISSNFWWQVIWEHMVSTSVVPRVGQPNCEGAQLHSEVHGLISSAPSSLWKLPSRDLFRLCPLIAIRKSCECLWDIIWSLLFLPAVSSSVISVSRQNSNPLSEGSTRSASPCSVSLGVTGVVVIALWSSSPGRLCKSFTQIWMVLLSHLSETQGTWPSLPVIPQRCDWFMLIFAKLGQPHYHGTQQVLSSCWPPQHCCGSPQILPQPALSLLKAASQVGTKCSSSKGSISSECVGLLPIHATFK